MRPNLAYLSGDGALLETVELHPALARNSIRHLAAREEGTVAFAMERQGALSEPVPLLGLHLRGGKVRLSGPDGPARLRLRGYTGSVAFSAHGARVGLTAPRGGRAQIFEAGTGRLAAEIRRADICVLAPRGPGFLATDGPGDVVSVEGGREITLAARDDRAWDNHLVAL